MHKSVRALQLILLVIMTVIMLCSWVDPSTVDVYTGMVTYTDTNGYGVVRLSGSIDYYLASYDGLGLTDSGILVNTASTVKSGICRINGVEYSCRFSSLGGFQIEQSYSSSGYTRTAWISYDLTPDQVPTSYGFPEYSLFVIAVAVIVLIVVTVIGKGVIF